MTALEIRPEEVGQFDYQAYKARRARMAKAVPRRVVEPVVKQVAPAERDWLMVTDTVTRYRTTFEQIRDAVLKKHRISREQFDGHQRGKAYVKARHEVWYLVSTKTSLSLPQIGRLSGGKDHTAVLSGIARYKEQELGIPSERIERNRVRARARYERLKAAKAAARSPAAMLAEG